MRPVITAPQAQPSGSATSRRPVCIADAEFFFGIERLVRPARMRSPLASISPRPRHSKEGLRS
jgi:hypothetical protein